MQIVPTVATRVKPGDQLLVSPTGNGAVIVIAVTKTKSADNSPFTYYDTATSGYFSAYKDETVLVLRED